MCLLYYTYKYLTACVVTRVPTQHAECSNTWTLNLGSRCRRKIMVVTACSTTLIHLITLTITYGCVLYCDMVKYQHRLIPGDIFIYIM